MEKNRLDLNELAGKQNLNLTIAPREDPAEMQSRLRREEADAAHQRRKDLTLFVTTFVVIVAAFGICAYIVLGGRASAEADKWATATLTSIVSGLVGYVTGKAVK
ncbi:MAG TPA: hypothetical protein VF546_24570 [Pyrinomonadaceae bacterium]|jgi:multidrug resistance efflux pump